MSRRNSSPTAGQMGFWTDVVEPPPLYIPPPLPLPLTEEPTKLVGFFVSEDLTVKGTKGKIRTNLEIIKALYKIEQEKRLPSPEEMALLARYSAFGGLAKVFDPSPKNPEISLFKEVKETLDPLDYKAAKASVVNAFYTDPAIIQAMWAYLERLGFRGGRVLEPAAATGLFFAGMPPALRAASELTAVELDRLSGRLGLYLHPDVTYHLKGLEETTFQPGYFDLVISNAPFGDYGVFDNSLTDAERNLCRTAIHDYYFIKAAQLVRRGGLVAMITSRFTLDKKEDAVRRYLAERFDLVGTVRLPSDTFSAFAGTDVITDILFLQRKAEDGLSRDPIWLDAEKVELKGPRGPEEFWINDYYTHAHPHAVLGQLTCRTGPYGAKLLVEGDIDPTTLTDRILAALPDVGTLYMPVPTTAQTARFTVDASLDKVREGSYGYQIIGGVRTVYQKVKGLAVPVNRDKTTLDRLVALVDLVALARNVLDQCLHGTDAALTASQAQLGDAYDHFVRKYGYLNAKYNRQLFADDPNAPFLRALERWNEEQQTATKTKVFTERTIRTLTAPTGAASAVDALAICLNQKGHIDLDYMATLYGKTKVEIVAELGDDLFHDPVLDQWQTKAEYLSGNVLQKLEAAQAQANPLYERNAAALRSVLPLPLLAEEITVSLGNTWVPVDVVSQFLKELYNPMSRVNHLDEPNYHASSYHWSFANVKSQVTYVPALGRWVVEKKGKVFNDLPDEKWGTSRRNVFVLLEAALNGSEVKVFDTVKEKLVLNATETIAAREKVNQLHKAFRQWVWLDPKRKQTLTDTYNRTFRGMVRPTYDGSYLTLPGTSLDLPPLRKNQKDGIARILQGGNVLLWHAVGAGKSRIMIIASMELKRLGLRNRPMHVVPNALLEQYATEFYRVYPHARILVVNSKKMEPKTKQETLARIATEDWDAILINASAFQRIPLNLETWEWLLMDQIAELEQAIEDREDDEDQRLTVKQLRGKLNRAEYRLQERRNQANVDKGGLTFEQMGIDALFYDEFHTARNLYFMTERGHLPGIGGDESGLAFDLFVKSQFVTRRCTKGHILGANATCSCGAERASAGQLVGATGTAITNSISEMFTLHRFFQMDLLIQKGLENFDAWASTFGETETVIEMNPSGKGWRTKERFVNFVNVPELLDLFKQVADIWINPDTLGLERPALATGAPIPIELDPIDELLDVMEHCARRADDLKNNRYDNMLAIMGTATRAATDVRLVGKQVDHPRSKANRLVTEVFRIWRETSAVQLPGLPAPVGLTQLVFLDIGVPGGDAFDLYNDLRAKWVALGVPPEQIAFATDYETDAQRKALYDAVNAGMIRILLATTGRAGMGVNIQRLLVALHHVDITWTPASVEQREGRILRPGNLNPMVWVYRYIVKKSLDFHKWHLLELKAKANRQLFMTDTTSRTVQDLDQAVLSFAQMKAIATGDPLLMEKVKIETDLNRLYALHDKYMQDRRSVDREIRELEIALPASRRRAQEYAQAYAAFAQWEEKPPVKVQGRVYKKRGEAGEHLQRLIDLKLADRDVVDLGYATVSLVPAFDGVWLEISCPPVRYAISPGDSATGHLMKVDNFLKKMEGDAQFYERQAEGYADRLAFLSGQGERRFAYQAELDAAYTRFTEIEAELTRRADHAVEVKTLAEGLETTA